MNVLSFLTFPSGSYINPSWFELDNSRGLDDPSLKIFMRASALISEFVIYVPAIVVLGRRLARLHSVPSWDFLVATSAILMQPATILIDHGHFQYNTIMLGLAAASICNLITNRILLASIFFVGALGFKQMALFYAPAIFAHLLGSSLFPRIRIGRLISIALVTLIAFAALYAPLLLGGFYDSLNGITIGEKIESPLLNLLPFQLDPKNSFHVPLILIAQSIHRIFPFARGLFEDKVANLWCALHTFHKLHVYPRDLVQKAALLATLAAITPPCLVLFFKPLRRDLVPLGFAATAWGFFLCSYQVHEKNVLLPLLPMTILLITQDGLAPHTRAWVGLANIVGCWTMFPLLQRDGLQIPYFTLTLLWIYLLDLPTASWRSGWLTASIHLPIYVAMAVWHIIVAFVPPPTDKPDLWTVANVLVGAGGFGLCYLWCIWSLFEQAGWTKKQSTTQTKKKQ
jgi:alpha-1,3-glucosyltransferase